MLGKLKGNFYTTYTTATDWAVPFILWDFSFKFEPYAGLIISVLAFMFPDIQSQQI